MFHRLLKLPFIWFSLFRDKRTPTRTKVLPLAALIYALFPIDMIPDILPLLGQLDDVSIIVLFLWIAFRAVSGNLYQEHEKKFDKGVIDVTPDK